MPEHSTGSHSSFLKSEQFRFAILGTANGGDPTDATAATVTTHKDLPARHLSLDEAIRTALANSEVVRVLNGVSASSSGRTIYDVAIQSQSIDEANAAFDPSLSVNNSFNRIDRPSNSDGTAIVGAQGDNYNLDANLTKKTITGGTLNLGVTRIIFGKRKILSSCRIRPSSILARVHLQHSA